MSKAPRENLWENSILSKKKSKNAVCCYLLIEIFLMSCFTMIIINDNNADVLVGYTISITGCPKKGTNEYLYDAAAILANSIQMISSIGKYKQYTMHALVRPDTVKCTMP